MERIRTICAVCAVTIQTLALALLVYWHYFQ